MEYDDLWLSNVDDDLGDVDSDEEQNFGEKSLALLKSLLSPSQSLTAFAEAQRQKFLSGNVGDDDIRQQKESEETDGVPPPLTMEPDETCVAVRTRPQVPPKPPIDTLRYSMNNIKESAEWQLDELLEELEALETQLNTSNGGDQLLLGMSSALPTSSSAHDQLLRAKDSAVSKPVAHHHHHQQPATSTCSSPDGDSAFGDSSSTESARCRDSSAFSSNESCRDSLNTPSPTQTSPRNGELSADELKAQRIRLALEKMKEAKVARILVKFFGEGGVPLQLLIDERWTVAETLRQLADKNHMTLMEDHCIVEEFPDLHIQRVYEDHENVVENISMWVQDSPNKLHFIRRPDKYSFIYRPEMYLVTEKTSHIEVPSGTVWKQDVKQKFVREFFTNETVVPPELEGFLYLKSDGRKSWKKHFFILRPSGLYYSPKGKKASKDLTCLMSMHSSQIYTGINWEKKYKSPTPWCISIKLTKLQIKNSQYIKYICADDELTFRKWVAALRIAKSGSDLLLNYERATGVRPCRPASPASSIAASVQSSNTTASSTSTTTSIAEMPTRPLTVDMRVISPSVASTMSKPPSLPSPSQSHASFSSVANSTVIEYDEQPTGTIKRAPIDALRYVSRMSSSSTSPTIPQEDTDSDEDFPAPPPSSLASRTPVQSPQGLPPPPKPAYYATPQPARPAAISPLVAPKPSTPLMAKKAPPPPPKRSEATRIQTVSATSPQPQQHMSDLEAALARRREKMAQVQ